MDGDGHFNPDVVYLLQTSDACNVLVRETGHAPNVFLLFETACDKYDWLNDVIAYGLAAQVAGGVSVEVFRVSNVVSLLAHLTGAGENSGRCDCSEANICCFPQVGVYED